MKKCLPILLCVFILACTASCGPANRPIPIEEITTIGFPKNIATPEEIEAEEQRFKERLQSLNAENISKLIFKQVTPNSYNEYKTSDKGTIVAWVDVFHRMEIKGVQLKPICGVGFWITVVEGNNETYLCSMGDSDITSTSRSVMYQIENYEKISESIRAAKYMVSAKLI